MSLLQEMFPLLIPIFVIDVILAVAAEIGRAHV